MITDIPSHEDYMKAAKSSLFLSFEVFRGLMESIEHLHEWLYDAGLRDANGNVVRPAHAKPAEAGRIEAEEIEYWEQAQPTLSNAITLLQQAQEMALKSRIASISPYLLIMSNPSGWSKKWTQEDAPFADMRSINASDLIKVHDCFAPDRLSDEIKDQFDAIRRMRNRVMHSATKLADFNHVDLLHAIMVAYHELIGGAHWFGDLENELENSHTSVAYSTDLIGDIMLEVFGSTMSALPQADAIRFFNFHFDKPTYCCPDCHNKQDFGGLQVETAQFGALHGNPEDLICILCGQGVPHERHKCSLPECNGDLRGGEDNICLTCLD